MVSSQYLFRLMALAVLFTLPGCAATSTFTSYPAKIKPLLTTVEKREAIDFGSCLLRECQSSDALLYEMERGRFAQIQGNFDKSMQDFASAMERIRTNDEKARISLSDVGANMAAVAVNDNAIPYSGAGYERVMLHHYQALNYLSKKDLEGAGVEVRRANAEQEEALRRHEEEVEKAKRKGTGTAESDEASHEAIATVYAQLDEAAGRVKNSFQNAYTFYLSGFIYETLQQPNDAYIDYKKALEIYPDNSYLQRDVLRLAQELEMTDDLEEIGRRFPIAAERVPPGSGDLLILFEDGFVPQKEEVKIPLPLSNVGVVAVAFPVYLEQTPPCRSLSVEIEGAQLGVTEPICDLKALSVKALKEQVPVIATRQLLRLVAKGGAAKKAKEELGALGELGMSVWNLISENADLRSWISLPSEVQIFRAPLPAGIHRLTLRQEGTTNSATVVLEIAPGSRNILHVVRAGGQFYTSAKALPYGNGAPVSPGVSARLQ